MKASLYTMRDGTVTIYVESECALEMQLLTVFFAQTEGSAQPAVVRRLGASHAQFISADRHDDHDPLDPLVQEKT